MNDRPRKPQTKRTRKKKRNGKCKKEEETKRRRRTSTVMVIKKKRNTNSVRINLCASVLVLVFAALYANNTTFEIVGVWMFVSVWSLVIRFEWDNQIFGTFFSFLFFNFFSTLFFLVPLVFSLYHATYHANEMMNWKLFICSHLILFLVFNRIEGEKNWYVPRFLNHIVLLSSRWLFKSHKWTTIAQ